MEHWRATLIAVTKAYVAVYKLKFSCSPLFSCKGLVASYLKKIISIIMKQSNENYYNQ